MDTLNITAQDGLNITNSSQDTEAFWNAVYADQHYLVSKSLGQYLMMIIFIIGIVGNLLSLLVMVQPNMNRSSSAFYLSTLAVADSVVLLVGCLRRWVIEVYEVDLLNENDVACSLVNFLQYWSFDVAVWILVAMTIDRVIVVLNPLKSHLYATRMRAGIVLGVIMILCAAINSHFFFTAHISPNNNICSTKDEYFDFYKDIWEWLDASIYSYLPFTILFILNLVIICAMTRANRRKRHMTQRYSKCNIKRNGNGSIVNPHRMTAMLLSITCAFLLFTAPSMVLNSLRLQSFDTDKPEDLAKYILTRQVVRVLLYLNHSINFFLYCVTGTKFRQELAAILSCKSARDRRRELTVGQSLASITVQVSGGYDRSMSRRSED